MDFASTGNVVVSLVEYIIEANLEILNNESCDLYRCLIKSHRIDSRGLTLILLADRYPSISYFFPFSFGLILFYLVLLQFGFSHLLGSVVSEQQSEVWSNNPIS